LKKEERSAMGLVRRENYRIFHFSALAAIIAFGLKGFKKA
jgi:hypothetical protein